jgi:ribulose-5-phosphate 4-epimerase/fuculose-1-phosphate aldolase
MRNAGLPAPVGRRPAWRAEGDPRGHEESAMNTTAPTARPRDCSEAEWKVRCDLAALYRLMAYHRWTDLIFTHISARVPGRDHHFLINRYGVLFHEMRASDLVKIDCDGNVVEDASETKPVNAAGFVIHSAVHMARADLACVIHTHTAAGIAVSAQQHGLLPISQHALKYYGHLAYHGYEGVTLDVDERERLVADLGQHDAMILRNHGLLAAGRSTPEAFDNIYFLERACQAQLAAMTGGPELIFPPEEVCRKTAEQFRRDEARSAKTWEAALRLVEDGRPDYRS